jgi:dCMP deaminase
MISKWDKKFMEVANLVAIWSKDQSTKVGCIIVGKDKQIISTGYNGFPKRINDDVKERWERPTKYSWSEHSERNAIYQCALTGVSTKDCTIYVNAFPCVDCARAIIQSGIIRLVTTKPDFNDIDENSTWRSLCKISLEMLLEAGIIVEYTD